MRIDTKYLFKNLKIFVDKILGYSGKVKDEIYLISKETCHLINFENDILEIF